MVSARVTGRRPTREVGPLPALAGARSAVPRVPEAFVPRERLTVVVEEGVARGMVIVSAPAGAGKTLLLASWARQRRSRPAWLSLDPEDGDPQQFWERVLASLQAAPGVPADSALATMTAPPAFDARFVTRLLQACDELAGPRVLVLDDLHVLTGSPAMESLAAALRRGVGSLRLVLSTRVQPALPLQRLRLSGELTEVHTADLDFDAVEAATLFALLDVDLTPTQLRSVLEKTEGWAAGLRLAALSLQGEGDVDAALRQLAGEQRTVADYFVEEVLARLSEEVTGFLLDTSALERVNGELANALTGREDGQQMLEELERTNLFVVALDERRAWYRYHRLFGDLLRHRMDTEEPQRSRELHRRAASWFAAHGEPVEAVRHLAAAGAWQDMARFAIRTAGPRMLGVERHALTALLRRFPAELVGSDPEVATAAAIADYADYNATGVHAPQHDITKC